MIRFASVGLFLFLLVFNAQAQCDKCPQIPGDISDFCFSYYSHPGKCARFTRDAKEFWYQDVNRKKEPALKLRLPAFVDDSVDRYLVHLAQDKAMRLGTSDILFLRRALNTWNDIEIVRRFDKNHINENFTLLPSGLAYRVLVPGTGKMPQAGKMVNVHYTGRLADGTKFDSSYDRKQTFGFKLGAKQVIAGWDEGIALFPVGSRVLLRIPPELGYGNRGIGSIPPNSVLYFEVEIISAD